MGRVYTLHHRYTLFASLFSFVEYVCFFLKLFCTLLLLCFSDSCYLEKAKLFKEQMALDRVLDYHHNPQQVTSMGRSGHRHRESIDSLCVLSRYRQFACVEQHSPIITLYNARTGNLVSTMKCNAVPLSLCHVDPMNALVACCSDTTMVRFNVGDANHKVGDFCVGGILTLWMRSLFPSCCSYFTLKCIRAVGAI